MPMKAKAGMNVFQRQNMLQIKEQEMLNREMKKEQAAAKERADKRAGRLKAQYTGKGRPGVLPAPAAEPEARAPYHTDGGEQIEVFVRETEPEFSRHYVIHEGVAGASPTPATSPPAAAAMTAAAASPAAPTYHTGVPCPSGPAGVAGAAAAETRCGKPSGPTGAARRSAKQPLEGATPQHARPGSASSTHHKAGHIPAYLRQRKQELKEEKDLLEQQAEVTRQRAKYPPGQVPLPQEEKDEILKGLESKKAELLLELNKMPMRFDTTSIRKRRNEIEEQIRDIEARLGLFSRKQVFVPGS